jgi:hypothetical protein
VGETVEVRESNCARSKSPIRSYQHFRLFDDE